MHGHDDDAYWQVCGSYGIPSMPWGSLFLQVIDNRRSCIDFRKIYDMDADC